MKKILTFLFCAAIFSLFYSCSKDSEGRTRTTYYASITLSGESEMIIDKGSEYVEPGYKAEMKGQDITNQVKVVSTVNTTKSGVYSVVYSAVNEDGFYSTASRTVIVLDPNDPVEGFYTTNYVTANGSSKYSGPWSTLVLALGNNNYSTSDYFAGWYEQGRGYGSNYAMTGNFAISDGKVKYINSYIAGWGDSLDNEEGDEIGTYNNGVFEWNVSYAGQMEFKVKITKN